MLIRPMAAVYSLGEMGRPAHNLGDKSGSAPFFRNTVDSVSFGNGAGHGAGLYSVGNLFKIMGAVELMTPEPEAFDEATAFGDNPVLL